MPELHEVLATGGHCCQMPELLSVLVTPAPVCCAAGVVEQIAPMRTVIRGDNKLPICECFGYTDQLFLCMQSGTCGMLSEMRWPHPPPTPPTHTHPTATTTLRADVNNKVWCASSPENSSSCVGVAHHCFRCCQMPRLAGVCCFPLN